MGYGSDNAPGIPTLEELLKSVDPRDAEMGRLKAKLDSIYAGYRYNVFSNDTLREQIKELEGDVIFWKGERDAYWDIRCKLLEERDTLRSRIEELERTYAGAIDYQEDEMAKIVSERDELRTRLADQDEIIGQYADRHNELCERLAYHEHNSKCSLEEKQDLSDQITELRTSLNESQILVESLEDNCSQYCMRLASYEKATTQWDVTPPARMYEKAEPTSEHSELGLLILEGLTEACEHFEGLDDDTLHKHYVIKQTPSIAGHTPNPDFTIDDLRKEVERLRAENEALMPKPVVEVRTFHVLPKLGTQNISLVEYHCVEAALGGGKLKVTLHDGKPVAAEIINQGDSDGVFKRPRCTPPKA